MSTVRFARDDGLGVVTLDNPPLNLISRQLMLRDRIIVRCGGERQVGRCRPCR